MDPRVKAIEQIVSAWNREGIVYAIAHGIEQYPDKLGRDVDVFVQKRHLERARRLAFEILKVHFEVVVAPDFDVWPRRAIFAFGKDVDLEIDLITELLWGPVTLVNTVTPIKEVSGLFRNDPWVDFAKNILIKILGGLKPYPFNWHPENEEIVEQHCRLLCGNKLTARLIDVLKKDPENVKLLTNVLRRVTVTRHFALHPFKSFLNTMYWLVQEIRPYLFRMFPISVVVGFNDQLKREVESDGGFKNSFFTGVLVKEWPMQKWRADFIGLSSILDWMSSNYATNTLKLVIYKDQSLLKNKGKKKIRKGLFWFLRKPDFILLNEDLVNAAYWERLGVPIKMLGSKADAKQAAREFRRIFIERVAAKYGRNVADG